MFRVSTFSLRPLANNSPAYFALKKGTLSHHSRRYLSNGLSQMTKQKPRKIQPPFFNGLRSIATNSMIQQQAFSWQKLAITAAGVAGTVVVLDVVINRETRDALSDAERSLLNDSFKYTGGGLALAALTARALFRSGATFRIMSANPWAVLGISLVGSIGTMMGAIYTAPENTVQKHLFWLAFNGFQAATLSPLFFYNPAILGRAALYTVGVVGAISYVGATAKNDKYLYLGAPLLAGVTVVALSSLAPMVIPSMGVRSLAIITAPGFS
ncbi:inhibitor of apoptosis-promoting Bax1-domain-containing protein [Crepidotus variabilis]|uniref:Inhibitor of apoptosis-promoting Bax1-domain-containing protein n=1 Tax=Crepidotus variabilis TaxID=179855 RepID=A0A9P6ENG3_9AGAR|nr:inhibitor of apoptosis-promoting Bax1-domain-containing protein [Crepidotus variabilis]